MNILFLSLVGCRIDPEEHSQLMNEINNAIYESETPNSHYLNFSNQDSCLSFPSFTNSPFFESSWTFSFAIPSKPPEIDTFMSAFQVSGTSFLFRHSTSNIKVLWCSDRFLGLDLETMNEADENCSLYSGAIAQEIDTGDRITISFKKGTRLLSVFHNASLLIEEEEVLDHFSAHETLNENVDVSFGCDIADSSSFLTIGTWRGGIDSLLLTPNAMAESILISLLAAEQEERLEDFLKESPNQVSYWSLGEDEYPDVLDSVSARHGIMSEGEFSRYTSE